MSEERRVEAEIYQRRREESSSAWCGRESQCFPCKKWFVTVKLKDKNKCPYCGKKLMHY